MGVRPASPRGMEGHKNFRNARKKVHKKLEKKVMKFGNTVSCLHPATVQFTRNMFQTIMFRRVFETYFAP